MTERPVLIAGSLGRAKPLDRQTPEAIALQGVSRSLHSGDFHLVIAGDGVRSDLQAIAAHLNGGAHGAARLSLVEVQLWREAGGQTVVVPVVPLRTEVIEQRVFMGTEGVPLRLSPVAAGSEDAEVIAPAADPARAEQRERNRAFWQAFIDEAPFDHADQPPPRHGGNNWVRIDLPSPLGALTAYRTVDGELGLFLALAGERGATVFESLASETDDLRQESGLDLSLEIKSSEPFRAAVAVRRKAEAAWSEADQRAWLMNVANRLVTLLRPRSAAVMQAAE